jgi:hypothetical protein
MSNYTKSTNFATKDNLTPGDPLKVVRGTEIDTEFNNIATAVATKTDNSAAAITGGSITGITDLAVADGGTGASTAAGGLNNLLPTQTGNANKYLQTDGTNATWDAVTLSTADITGTLPVANGGTGVTSSTGTGSVVLSNSPTLVTPALGTPASGVATNLTGLPISTGVSGLGTGVATFLGTPSSANLISAVTDETGTGSLVFATSPTLVTPALGTPSALVGTNITGTASGLTAGNVTTNANLTGAVTSVGNATSLGSFTSSQLAGALTDETGSGSAVFATSPTLVTPILGTPTSVTLTNATGLPISTGVSGLGTGIATALAVNTGSAGAPVLFNGALGTPSSGTVTNLTGTASININGTVGATTATTGAFTTLTTSSTVTHNGGTANGVTYLNGSKVLTSGSALTFDGATLFNSGNIGLSGAGTGSRYVALLNETNTYAGSLNLQAGGGSAAFGGGVTMYGHAHATYPGAVWLGYSSGTSTGIIFGSGGNGVLSEAMRLNNTGLGIGTSSPAYKLHVYGTDPAIGIQANAGTSDAWTMQAVGSDNRWRLVNNTSGVGEVLTVTRTGNLGLGVTPSASSFTTMQIKNASLSGWASDLSAMFLTANTRFDGTNFRYISTSFACQYRQQSGDHYWYNAASGTAGDAISFTQAMTLTAAGDLGLGTTSPATYGSRTNLYVAGTLGGALILGEAAKTFQAVVLGDYNNGQMDVGTATNHPMRFITNNTERARITAGGDFLFGRTTVPVQNTAGAAIQNTGLIITESSQSQGGLWVNRITSDGTAINFTRQNVAVGSISVTGSATAYNTSSDQRLKENIVDAPDFGILIDSLQVRSFDWKANGAHQRAGFIAQELVTVAPEAVYQPEDTEQMMAVDYSKLVPMLVKEIQSLRQRLSAANL